MSTEFYDLFPVDETLSPRLAWMRKHGIELESYPDDVLPFKAHCPKMPELKPAWGYGEDSALETYAISNNIPVWYV